MNFGDNCTSDYKPMNIEEVTLKILHSNGVISEITAKIDELWHIECPPSLVALLA